MKFNELVRCMRQFLEESSISFFPELHLVFSDRSCVPPGGRGGACGASGARRLRSGLGRSWGSTLGAPGAGGGRGGWAQALRLRYRRCLLASDVLKKRLALFFFFLVSLARRSRRPRRPSRRPRHLEA